MPLKGGKPLPKPAANTIIVIHRLEEVGMCKFMGRIKLVNPETGEIVHTLEPHLFVRCHAMYASYKLLFKAIRFLTKCGYNRILLDTNYKRFAEEMKRQETTRALQKQLVECCVINGVTEICIIN